MSVKSCLSVAARSYRWRLSVFSTFGPPSRIFCVECDFKIKTAETRVYSFSLRVKFVQAKRRLSFTRNPFICFSLLASTETTEIFCTIYVDYDHQVSSRRHHCLQTLFLLSKCIISKIKGSFISRRISIGDVRRQREYPFSALERKC